MSLLFKNLRIHQVFGANTGVGKTVLTLALARAAAAISRDVFYLKPVSTGPSDESDTRTFERHAPTVDSTCLYQFDLPVSPHLAASLATSDKMVPSDTTVARSISSHIRRCASRCISPANYFVETAGGAHSPTPLGTSQLDLYRPLLLPTILVGDSKLGGISSTITAFESLLLRGYEVDLVMLFREDYYRNWEYLDRYFRDRHGIPVHTLSSPPSILSNPEENYTTTEKYLKSLEEDAKNAIFTLDYFHERRLEELSSMPQRTRASVWWPFVQHRLIQSNDDVNVITSAHSDFFNVSTSKGPSLLEPQFDGSASWWTQCLGHAHPSLTLAAARAAGRYGHVMFPQATHRPALQLAETLLQHGPGKGWASRAFFSDDGSTGMEVALKMAMRYYSKSHSLSSDQTTRLGVLGLKGSYHGDTIGAMDATEKSGVYTSEWHQGRGVWIEPPTVSIQNGTVSINAPTSLRHTAAIRTTFSSLSKVYDINARINSPLAHAYSNYLKRVIADVHASDRWRIGALVLEPLAMGAGGMIFVDPLFQRILIDTTRSLLPDVPVIFDEVFIGLYRLGLMSGADILQTNPDISTYAKILTGGLIPLSITLASKTIFEAFLSDSKADALLHGHSYTANPVGCEVANETWRLITALRDTSVEWREAQTGWEKNNGHEGATIWSFWDPGFINALSRLPVIDEVMAMGTVLKFRVRGDGKGYTSQSAQQMLNQLRSPPETPKVATSSSPDGAPFGFNYRTLGDVAYFMTSLNTPPEVIREVEERIWNALAT